MIRQYLDVKFDKPIDKERDFISPGGYEIELKDGRRIRYDFMDYKGYIDTNDRSILHIIHSNLDIDSFPESKALLDIKSEDISKIIECYIYTGESDENRIKPIKILDWWIKLDDTSITIDKSIYSDYEFKE